MKLTLLLLFFAFSGSLFSKLSDRGIFMQYRIVSDAVSNDVPIGKCRVKGTIVYDGQSIPNVLISNLNQSHQTHTDSLGNFRLLIDELDSVVYFYHPYYGEIVMNPYDYISKHEVVIEFFPQPTQYMIEDKPVIYLYSDKSLDVDLSLQFRGNLTFSYPLYQDGWKVTVNANGMIDRKSNQSFPYLFWEGEADNLRFNTSNDIIQGFVIQTDTIVSFLENQLNSAGLNAREKTDFITFWAPRMMQSKFVLLQFLVDDLYDQEIAGISCFPQPDAMRRIFMLYESYAYRPTVFVEPQVFESFERNGFTLVEWGGSDITPIKPTK